MLECVFVFVCVCICVLELKGEIQKIIQPIFSKCVLENAINKNLLLMISDRNNKTNLYYNEVNNFLTKQGIKNKKVIQNALQRVTFVLFYFIFFCCVCVCV